MQVRSADDPTTSSLLFYLRTPPSGRHTNRAVTRWLRSLARFLHVEKQRCLPRLWSRSRGRESFRWCSISIDSNTVSQHKPPPADVLPEQHLPKKIPDMGSGPCHTHLDGHVDGHLRHSPWNLPLGGHFSTRIADAREGAFADASSWPGMVVCQLPLLPLWCNRDRASDLPVDHTAHESAFCEEELL